MMKRILEYIIIALIGVNLILTGSIIYTNYINNNEYINNTEVHEHSIVIDSHVDPTCQSIGLSEGCHCSTCGEILIAQEEIPITDHFIVDRACITCNLRASDCLLYRDFTEDTALRRITIDKIGESIVESTLHIFPYCNDPSVIDSVQVGNSTIPLGIIKVKECFVYPGVDILAGNAFCKFKEMKFISLPDTLIEIRLNAFQGCEALESLTIPESVNYIGQYAFSGCKSLKTIKLPTKLTIIERNTFDRCSSLAYIDLPETTKFIGEEAFFSCTRLKTINIGAPKSIGAWAFAFCSNLTEINVALTLEEWNNTFKGEYWSHEVSPNCKIICLDGETTVGDSLNINN